MKPGIDQTTFGPTSTGRMLAIILAPRERGAYYVVTAHNANAGEQQRYSELKGRKETMSEQSEPRESRIPEFSNIEEEAKFWDTHDTTEFEDEFKPVQVRFAKNLSEGFKVRFDPETARKIREYAHEQGIGPTTLIRMWILEHLRQDEQRHAS